MGLRRFALGEFDGHSWIHWGYVVFLACGGVYLVATSVRWVTTPGARRSRFRNLASVPVGEKILFVITVMAYAVVGAVSILIAVATPLFGLVQGSAQ